MCAVCLCVEISYFLLQVGEEPSVVYTSIIIRRPAKTTDNYVSYSECVYSEIKV